MADLINQQAGGGTCTLGMYQLEVGAHNSTYRGYNPAYPFISDHL